MTKRHRYFRFLLEHGACIASREWILENKHLSPRELWDRCRKPSWMHWLINTVFGSDSKESKAEFVAWYESGKRDYYNTVRKAVPFDHLIAELDRQIPPTKKGEVTSNG